jgi:sulfate permease, SulP family
MNLIDVAGAELLVREAKRLRQEGRMLYLFNIKPGIRDFIERGGYILDIGADCVFESKGTGLPAVVSQLNSDRCANCTARIFHECPDAFESIDADLILNPA